MAVCDRSEILYPRQRNDLFFTQSGLHPDSISGQARGTTVQVWTVEERFGIGSEFRQICCAANNFRDHDLDLVKAILVHCAHRLLSESTLILRTLRNGPRGKQTPGDFTRLRSIPEPHAFSTVVFYGLRIFSRRVGNQRRYNHFNSRT
jgi:hypothetical protein